MVLPWCKTDTAGCCDLQHLEFGKYQASASKEEDNYPKLEGSFYASASPIQPVVNLTADQPSAPAVIHLGRKAGVLTGKVVDAVSGKVLEDSNFEFHWVSDPRIFLRGTGLYSKNPRILIPSDTPVTLVVHVRGHEDWVYSLGRGELKDAILLRPGEVLALDIRVWPKL